MDKRFIARCDAEIKTNSVKKGSWADWNPTTKKLVKELAWHEAKLHAALLTGNVDGVQEYAADVANICEKAFTMAAVSENDLLNEGDY